MAKRIPFDFVLDLLATKNPLTKPMFGAYGVYVDEKIVFILRERDSYPQDNGVWIATVAENHESLKRDLPIMRSIEVFGPGVTGWQNLPVSSPEFEASAQRAVELVLKGDPRIGKLSQKKVARKKAIDAIAARANSAKSQKPKASLSRKLLQKRSKAKKRSK